MRQRNSSVADPNPQFSAGSESASFCWIRIRKFLLDPNPQVSAGSESTSFCWIRIRKFLLDPNLQVSAGSDPSENKLWIPMRIGHETERKKSFGSGTLG
jgi:hypothetical protein